MLDNKLKKAYTKIEELDLIFKEKKLYGHFSFEFNYIDGQLKVINIDTKEVFFKENK